jgi:hypothetical protein
MSLRQFIPAIIGPTAGRFAAVAHARLAARCYYDTRWIAGLCPPRSVDIAQLFPLLLSVPTFQPTKRKGEEREERREDFQLKFLILFFEIGSGANR